MISPRKFERRNPQSKSLDNPQISSSSPQAYQRRCDSHIQQKEEFSGSATVWDVAGNSGNTSGKIGNVTSRRRDLSDGESFVADPSATPYLPSATAQLPSATPYLPSATLRATSPNKSDGWGRLRAGPKSSGTAGTSTGTSGKLGNGFSTTERRQLCNSDSCQGGK